MKKINIWRTMPIWLCLKFIPYFKEPFYYVTEITNVEYLSDNSAIVYYRLNTRGNQVWHARFSK